MGGGDAGRTFLIFFVVVVIQIYKYVKIHRMYTEERKSVSAYDDSKNKNLKKASVFTSDFCVHSCPPHLYLTNDSLF